MTSLQPILRYALNQESGLGFDTMINLGPVPTQISIEFHYNLAHNDLLNPQWQVRVVLTPVVPAPAWAGRALFGN